MAPFDPKVDHLITIADTVTSDLKAGFTGQTSQAASIVVGFES